MMKTHPSLLLAGFGLLLSPAAIAQQDEPAMPMDATETVARTEAGGWRLSLDAAVAYQFEADLDDAGDYSVLRSGVRLNASTRLSDVVGLSLRARYRYDDFDFSDDVFGLTESPWSGVHTTGVDAVFEVGLSEELRLFFGPSVQSAWESGADFDDGITIGGVVGFSYRLSSDVAIGALVSVRDEIEDDVDVIVLPIVEWDITDNWRVGSVGGPSSFLVSGVQLSYSTDEAWRFGLGVGYSRSRFRLDDEGPAPDGVGEESGLPIWLGVGYRPSNTVELDFLAGVLVGGELRLEDEDGSLIDEQDVDPAPFIGVAARFRF